MENNFYFGEVCHLKKNGRDFSTQKLVLYTNDGFNFIDLLNRREYTTDINNRDYVIEESLIPTDISEHRTNYLYLLKTYKKRKMKKILK